MCQLYVETENTQKRERKETAPIANQLWGKWLHYVVHSTMLIFDMYANITDDLVVGLHSTWCEETVNSHPNSFEQPYFFALHHVLSNFVSQSHAVWELLKNQLDPDPVQEKRTFLGSGFLQRSRMWHKLCQQIALLCLLYLFVQQIKILKVELGDQLKLCAPVKTIRRCIPFF